jgi:hypothetical protein
MSWNSLAEASGADSELTIVKTADFFESNVLIHTKGVGIGKN